ncbi:MAG: SulP family inorganic anion transporter, partial [Clostridia bacterium]|nr:SulP family inorganic anion transporter [Clostridia bacterium]
MKDRKKRPFFKHYKKIFVNEFKGYNGSRLVKDILAGLTVGAVALPLALAFGAASIESNPALGIAAGLITAIIAGIVTGLLGGGSFQISGPTGAMTVVLGSIVGGQYGVQGMFVATALAGIILLVAGLFRFGKIIQFIPCPVITGFTCGMAIVIALGQLGNFFGVSLVGETTVDKLIYFFTDTLGDINVWAVVFTLVVVAIMFVYPKKWGKVVPASLVAIIFTTVLAAVMQNVEGFAVNTIGNIPTSIINSET